MRAETRVVVCAALLLLGGCAHKTPEVPGMRSGTAAMKVGEVTDAGGIDDKSFNALAWEGLKRAQSELGVEAKYLESREIGDYKTNLSTLADQGSTLVFAVGYMMEDALKEIAPSYPNTKFAIIDGSAPNAPNCVSLKFREEEGSFLAGYLAGRMTKTGTIGFVGGIEGPLIKKFEVGYYAGARTARPDIHVLIKYVGSWTDVPKGKELAILEFQQGADIVFAAAGKSGLGVLDAANDRGSGYYAIGVDADQDYIHPGRILTSMMKGVDVAVYQTVKDLKEGKWQPGEHVFGVKEGGVHLSPMTYTRKDVPPDILAKLDEITKMISDGRIHVPSTDAGLENFQVPRLQ
ncbi:MAG: BMP family lipoprotein [Chthonomonadales bacterium]